MSEPVDIDELYPSERNEATILWADLQRKYGDRPSDAITLFAFEKEAKERFANEVGLVVDVDVTTHVVANNGDLVPSPTIEILHRVDKNEFDFSRATYETQHGYYDGKPGVVTESGIVKDPKLIQGYEK